MKLTRRDSKLAKFQSDAVSWADQICRWLTGDRLLLTRIHELLLVRGGAVSYSSLRRFIVKRNWGRRSVRTVRMADTGPGEVDEVDFGRLGLITDPAAGKRKAVWALIVVLSYSRHCFVWPTHSKKLADVIAGLEAAWAFFGGAPRYLVKALKSLGWKWDKTRRTDPTRISRHWLVMSVATLLALAYGTRIEDPQEQAAPGNLRMQSKLDFAHFLEKA